MKPSDIKVNGIEKYRVSLNTDNTCVEEAIPIIIKRNPGIPRYLRGRLNAINSINVTITFPLCEIGFFDDVFPPVS